MSQSSGQWIKFKCLEVTQPIGTFYVGVITSQDLLRVAYSDVRRLESEPRAVEQYLGIERPLDRKRVGALMNYVDTLDATFPGSILIAVASEDSEYDTETGELSLRNDPDVAKILDGQHRIAGLEGFQKEFDLIVTLFVDMDIENQAMTFAVINLEQTKVNKSLAYDLYEYTKSRSPQKTAHNIVRLLDTEEGTPFLGKIKILGTAGDPGETLSQALFVDSLLGYLSANPNRDRDLLKRGRKPPRLTSAEEQRVIFGNMFLDEKDANIARVLWNYFGAVEDKWGDFWREVNRGYILNRTTGFKGLMQFLRYAYLGLAMPGEVPSRDEFSQLFKRVNLTGEQFIPDNYPPGTSGPTRLRDQLLSQTRLS